MNVIKQFKSRSKSYFNTRKVLSFVAATTLGVSLLGLQACGGGGGGTATPATPTLSVAAASVVEGDTTSGVSSNMIFSVSLSLAASQDVVVAYSTADNTATLTDSDYTASSGDTITILAGNTSGTITIPVIADDDLEFDEQFDLLISATNATVASGSRTVTGTILSDDSLAGYYTNSADTKVNGPASSELTIPAGQFQVITDIDRMAIIDLVNNLVYIVDIDTLNPSDFSGTARVYKDGDFTNTTTVMATFTNVGTAGDLIDITLAGPNGEDYSTTNGTMTLSYSAKNGDAPLVFAVNGREPWQDGDFPTVQPTANMGFVSNSITDITVTNTGSAASFRGCRSTSISLANVIHEQPGRIRSFSVSSVTLCAATTPIDGYVTSFDTTVADDTLLFVWFNDGGVRAAALSKL